MDYTTLIINGYAHTYAVVNFTTGEICTIASEVGAYALRAMYKRFDSYRRYEPAHLVLVNCVTGVVLEEVGA
jgi:hypothetical protein